MLLGLFSCFNSPAYKEFNDEAFLMVYRTDRSFPLLGGGVVLNFGTTKKGKVTSNRKERPTRRNFRNRLVVLNRSLPLLRGIANSF